MTELEIVKKKIRLARQSLKFSSLELDELELRYILLKAKLRLEQQMNREYDPALSQRLDCINYLLER